MIRYAIVQRMPAWVKALARGVASVWMCADVRSLVRYLRITRQWQAPPVADLRLRALHGRAVRVRGRQSDARVLLATFTRQFHLPPAHTLRQPPRLVLDLGANIGLTAVHMAARWPEAFVLAVEMDDQNACLCRHNATLFPHRIAVTQAAVWSEATTLHYRRSPDDDGLSVVGEGDQRGPEVAISARTIDDLVAPWLDRGVEGIIDVLKLDIEGAEREVLEAGGAWVRRTRVLVVELHGDYSRAQAMDTLRRLGFDAYSHQIHHDCAVGVRPDL